MDDMPLALVTSGCDAVEVLPVAVVVGIVPGVGAERGVSPGGYTLREPSVPGVEVAPVVVVGPVVLVDNHGKAG